MDGTPDNDHGANSASALQSMLLQSDGDRILLLPAWPEDWDVSFRLCAGGNTSVECEYRAGRVQSLKVTPASRLADVVDFSSPARRVRTLLEVACADRNHLFGLPPMLDARPIPGPATRPWLERHGECFDGTRAGPWPDCLFRASTLYAFAFDGAVRDPDVPARVVRRTPLAGGTNEPVTIVKFEYDQPLDPFALAAPSRGSLTAGHGGTTVDLGEVRTFDRVEVTLDNPGYRRGQARSFEVQVRDEPGEWRTVHRGRVFGMICSQRFEPVSARRVRLVTDAAVRQFDLFRDGAIRVLILSGQNNHDWRTTTPKLRSILEADGRFRVEVAERPDRCTVETFGRFDVVLGNWNAWGDAAIKSWPAATREAFLDFLRRGGGYVTIHAGSSSFYDWPEYQQIGGMFWTLDVTSHGAPHEFPVEFPIDHPITHGLATFRTKDELWLRPGVHPAARVIATGEGQPLAVTTELGRGRGFALLLGHSAEFMNSSGFGALLRRGAEWAATGKVDPAK